MLIEVDSGFLGDVLSSSEDSNVLHSGLTIVSEGWSLHNADLQIILQLVDDEGGEDFAFNIVGND